MTYIIFICSSLLTPYVMQANQVKPPELSEKMVRQSWKVRKAIGSKNYQVLTINKKKEEAMFIAASRDCVAMVHAAIKPKFKLEPINMRQKLSNAEIGNSIWPPRNRAIQKGESKPISYSSYVSVIDVMCHSIEAGASDSFSGSIDENYDNSSTDYDNAGDFTSHDLK